MSQDSNPNEVTIFHDSAVFENPAVATGHLQAEMDQRAEGASNEAGLVAAAVALEKVNPDQTQNSTQSEPISSNQLVVDYVKLRPSTALLILRLLGLGFVIILFLLLIGFFSDLMTAMFRNYSPLIENRYVLLLTGVIVYMVVGFVIYEQWNHRIYTIYRDHILMEHGWIFRTKRNLDMNQFGGAMVEQNLMGKLFKFGSIRLLFQGAIGRKVGESLDDISEPFENYQLMMSLIRSNN